MMSKLQKDRLDFTYRAEQFIDNAVKASYFYDRDAEIIYKTLEEHMRLIPFGDYLKRYIYKKAELMGDYDKVELKVYQRILKDSFSYNHTPASFESVLSKISTVSKNWLTQKTVKRKVVFLLGFGLCMSVEEVNEFLTKVLQEQGINFKKPFEIICWYCFQNKFNYLKYEKLWKQYLELSPAEINESSLYNDYTIGFRQSAQMIKDDFSLLVYLSSMKTEKEYSRFSATARKKFFALYDEARDLIVGMYNETEEELNERRRKEYLDKLAHNDRLYDYEKVKRLESKKRERYVFSREDISASDIEHVICCAIPQDAYGNLVPSKKSKLYEHFKGKRLSRQHMNDILAEKTEVDRFDLITLNFFIYSQKLEEYPNTKKRYESFVACTNEILKECSMGKLYVANPYECFILMCVLAEEPLAAYADVDEMAYAAEIE